MKKYPRILFVAIILTPSIAFASWWNPISWFLDSQPDQTSVIVSGSSAFSPQTEITKTTASFSWWHPSSWFRRNNADNSKTQNVLMEQDAIATTSESTIEVDNTISEKTVAPVKPSKFLDGVKINTPKLNAVYKSANENTKPVPVTQKVDDTKENFQEFQTRGKEIIALIEQDEKNFKLLADTIAQHKKQSAEHATQTMNAWVTLVDQNISSVSSQYGEMLNSTKKYLISDRDWVVDYSNSMYDIVSNGGYLLEQREVEALRFVKSELGECLKMGAEEWVALNGQSCTINFFEFLKPDYSKQLTNGANKLAEVDLMVLETIGKHARSAEDDVRGDMDTIARYTQLNASIRASADSLDRQLQQRQAQFEAANTPIKCYTSTSDSIFDTNRTYSTTCQTDTRTPQQICDEKIAAWLAHGGAYDPTSKPSC